MGVIAQRCENVTLRGSGAAADRTAGSFARKGSGIETSLQVDATHFSNCKGLVLVENCFFAYCVPILAEPYLLIGKSAQEGITEGALTGGCPAYPKYVISNKAPRPSVDMSGDIEIPDIGAITNKVLGVDLEHQVGDPGNNNYPALSKIWEMAWREANPDFIGPAPNPPDFNDSYERTKFWNSLTPEQRVRYSAMVADPNVTKKAIVLDLYCARGQSAVHFSEEKIDLLSGVGTSVGVGNLGLEFGADGKALPSLRAFSQARRGG